VLKKLYACNIPFTVTEEELSNVFSVYGEVKSVKIVKNRETKKPLGYCFIEMENAEEAISKLNGTDMGGRTISVREPIENKKENK